MDSCPRAAAALPEPESAPHHRHGWHEQQLLQHWRFGVHLEVSKSTHGASTRFRAGQCHPATGVPGWIVSSSLFLFSGDTALTEGSGQLLTGHSPISNWSSVFGLLVYAAATIRSGTKVLVLQEDRDENGFSLHFYLRCSNFSIRRAFRPAMQALWTVPRSTSPTAPMCWAITCPAIAWKLENSSGDSIRGLRFLTNTERTMAMYS